MQSSQKFAVTNSFVTIGAIFAFMGIGIGAFGAHAVKNTISPASLIIYQTGVQYHLVHALALVLVGILGAKISPWVGKLFSIGICIFSGSLYALALTGIKWLGAITPIGGVCFLAGWALLAYSSTKTESGENSV
jgi:uncharacterized membrane protein YgdD (TMEM256/DUF423 family)